MQVFCTYCRNKEKGKKKQGRAKREAQKDQKGKEKKKREKKASRKGILKEDAWLKSRAMIKTTYPPNVWPRFSQATIKP